VLDVKTEDDKMIIHDKSTCKVCKIIADEESDIEKIVKINEQRILEGKELFDDGSRIPAHCSWCIENVVWDGDHWCSEECYKISRYWFEMNERQVIH